MTGATTTSNRLAELRTEFDRTFSIPPSSQGLEQIDNLLAIRVAGDSYAIRVMEISGLANNRKIVPLPSPIPELLGVASMRGGFLSVYNLEALLGYKPGPDPPRWLALCGSDEPVGLAFREFEGYLRVPLTQIYAPEQRDSAREHVKCVVRTADMVRAVVSIPYLIEMIKKRCYDKSVLKER
jgi:chemotaxis signal transduction protein